MVATQNTDTLGTIWTFSLRGVLTFVASRLDINGCWLSYFEGTAHSHCYTSCTLTTLHCIKLSFLQCCPTKIYNKYLQKCERCTHFCETLYKRPIRKGIQIAIDLPVSAHQPQVVVISLLKTVPNFQQILKITIFGQVLCSLRSVSPS